MATKAELESELAQLRAELAQAREMARAMPPEDARPDASREAEPAPVDRGEIESLISELRDEIEAAAHEKPLLVAACAFVLGLLIGRGTSR